MTGLEPIIIALIPFTVPPLILAGKKAYYKIKDDYDLRSFIEELKEAENDQNYDRIIDAFDRQLIGLNDRVKTKVQKIATKLFHGKALDLDDSALNTTDVHQQKKLYETELKLWDAAIKFGLPRELNEVKEHAQECKNKIKALEQQIAEASKKEVISQLCEKKSCSDVVQEKISDYCFSEENKLNVQSNSQQHKKCESEDNVPSMQDDKGALYEIFGENYQEDTVCSGATRELDDIA